MTIYVVDLEYVPTRYTCEWKSSVPELIKASTDEPVVIISGGEDVITATPGAFLNFQQTNIYKNNQINDIARRFTNEIQPGDRFIFLDAWHTGILQLKYMSELLNKPVEIMALWHAGSYDPQDFLGRLIKDKKWTYNTERAIYNAVDYNWFATDFHIKLFENEIDSGKSYKTGWPMEYMPEMFRKYDSSNKEDIIVFPHRLAPEKQPEIFRDLEKALPEYKFVVCQDQALSKSEYHELLAKSKMMWSANLQETLGISPYEGALLGVYPLLPDRLSYSEMYPTDFLYPSRWTESYNSYLENKDTIVGYIRYKMETYDENVGKVKKLSEHLGEEFFSAGQLLKVLVK